MEKDKKINNKIQQKINALVLQSREAGIPSFIYGFVDPKAGYFVHAENIPLTVALNLYGLGWLKIMEMEINSNPGYSLDHQQILKDAIEDFKKLSEKASNRIKNLKK